MYFTFVFIAPVYLFLTNYIYATQPKPLHYMLHSTLHLSYTKIYICYMVTLTTVDTSLTPTTTPTPTNTRGKQ